MVYERNKDNDSKLKVVVDSKTGCFQAINIKHSNKEILFKFKQQLLKNINAYRDKKNKLNQFVLKVKTQNKLSDSLQLNKDNNNNSISNLKEK